MRFDKDNDLFSCATWERSWHWLTQQTKYSFYEAAKPGVTRETQPGHTRFFHKEDWLFMRPTVKGSPIACACHSGSDRILAA